MTTVQFVKLQLAYYDKQLQFQYENESEYSAQE